MELLYLLEGTYNIVKELLLTSKYNISFDREKWNLSIAVNDKYISSFWAKNVSDVIAVVGENGAGKTESLLKIISILKSIQEFDQTKRSFICVIENATKSELVIWCSGEYRNLKCSAKKIKTRVVSWENGDIFWQDIKRIKTVYFNNMLTQSDYQYVKGFFVDDKSLGALIRDSQPYFEESEEICTDIDLINNYFSFERLLIIDFLFRYSKTIQFEMPFKMPSKIRIQVINMTMGIDRIDDEISSVLDRNRRDGIDIQFLEDRYVEYRKNLYDIVEMSSTLIVDIFIGLIINAFLEVCIAKSTRILVGNDGTKVIKDNKTQEVLAFVDSMEFIEDITISEEQETIYSAVRLFFSQMKDRLDDSIYNPDLFDKYERFICWLERNEDFFKVERSDCSNTYILVDSENEKRAKEFLMHFAETSRYHEYISFDFGLSNGEYNFIRVFANLYSIIDDSKQKIFNSTFEEKIECTDILLLFDEVDTSMHAKWQQKYLYWLLQFIETAFKEYKVKIILTTHSPIVLSDMLKDNVIYIKKGTEITSEQCKRDVCTFGNNIHTLFLDSFFLDDTGTIGAFAEKKINEVAQKLLNEGPLEDELQVRKIIDNVGDDIIHNRLVQLYNKKANNKQFASSRREQDPDIIDMTIELLKSQIKQIEVTIRELERKNDKN